MRIMTVTTSEVDTTNFEATSTSWCRSFPIDITLSYKKNFVGQNNVATNVIRNALHILLLLTISVSLTVQLFHPVTTNIVRRYSIIGTVTSIAKVEIS